MTELDDPKYKEHLRKVNAYWSAFYDKLDKQIKEEYPTPPELLQTEVFDMQKFKEYVKFHDQCRIELIKKNFSSTHTWVPGKVRWSKRRDNAFKYPVECSVCRMGASLHTIGPEFRLIDFDSGELPSVDMHGNRMHRTCQEVLAAREEYRKKRKGRKCYQCYTYGCWQE